MSVFIWGFAIGAVVTLLTERYGARVWAIIWEKLRGKIGL